MPITILSRADLTTAIKAFFTSRFPSRNLGTEGFLGKTWRAIAMAIWAFEKAVQDADRDATPTSDTSTDGLDNWAEVLGLPNGDGGYGRRGETAATGGVVQATGTNGTVINDGTQAVASDGVTIFQSVDGPYTIAAGVASVTMEAVTEGEAGNLDSGEVVTWISPPAGLDGTADVTTAFSGGEDEESNGSLLYRIQFRLRNPPKGGTAADYRYWCENAENVTTGDAIAIEQAFVYPLRQGTGSVDTVITVSGQAQTRSPAAGTVTNVQDYVNSVRPVTVEEANVLAPYMPNGQGMTLRTRLVPSIDTYNFDWDDTAAAYPTVKSYPTTLSVEINGAAPAALIAAVAEYQAGNAAAPRIQIAGTGSGAPIEAQQVRVTAINTAPADDILTVAAISPATALQGTAVNGDVIYAGGPMVADIQEALLDYVDQLGPSRASGYADPDDYWSDTCAIARMTQVALDVTDTDGTNYASNIVSGGVTINGAAADVTATDDGVNAPGMLYAKVIVVTQ